MDRWPRLSWLAGMVLIFIATPLMHSGYVAVPGDMLIVAGALLMAREIPPGDQSNG